MSEEEKCREAFAREYSMLTGEKRAYAWSVWTTCWNLRQQAPDGLVPLLTAIWSDEHEPEHRRKKAAEMLSKIADAPKPEDVK